MPFYEYQCEACGAHHEAMQKISDPPLRKCPGCGRARLKRLLSAPVFRLKGGGWYETDFKSDKEQKRNLHGPDEKPAKDGDAAAKPDAKGDGKADAKPAAEPAKPADKPKITVPVRKPAARAPAKPAKKPAKKAARR